MQPKAAGFIFEGGGVTIPGATAGADLGRPTGPAYAGWHMPGGQIPEKTSKQWPPGRWPVPYQTLS
jgi:hypothetical protein